MKTLLKSALWLAVLALPATAGAQTQTKMTGAASAPTWYVSPIIGATFGGDTTSTGTTVGLSGGWRKGMWVGEAEFAGTPNFFEQTGFLTDRWVNTFFGNVMIGVPAGQMRLKPYALAGLGVVKAKLAEAGEIAVVDVTQGGFDVGGGVAALLNERVGFRADLRYIRSFGDSANDNNLFGLEISKLNFVRVSAGLLVCF